jgi:ABC-2 type transport system ATP-binding protein
MIRVQGVSKFYSDIIALDNISFEVRRGEILGFLGPNAAGKTTTMRILSCFIPPTHGTATVAGHDIFKASLEVRKKIGYLPENAPLYNDMRVREYLDFRARLKGVRRARRRQAVDTALERCGAADVRGQVIGTLSKGYRQRVGLAEALVHEPEILILDEPTVGLDPNQIRQVRALIRELGKNHTILLSTHILPEVEMVCGRVIIINKGRIVAMDTPENLLAQLRGGRTLCLEIGGPPEAVRERLAACPGVASVHQDRDGEDGYAAFSVLMEEGRDPREDIFRAVVAGGWTMREMKFTMVSLEEIFYEITAKEEEDQR